MAWCRTYLYLSTYKPKQSYRLSPVRAPLLKLYSYYQYFRILCVCFCKVLLRELRSRVCWFLDRLICGPRDESLRNRAATPSDNIHDSTGIASERHRVGPCTPPCVIPVLLTFDSLLLYPPRAARPIDVHGSVQA